MTKTGRVTKRSIAASFLALAFCVSMLVGTSYAWFTDSVTSSGNIIKSGKLDIEMSWKDGKENPTVETGWQDASTGAIFTDDVLWEPGFVQVRHINIKNVGNLALHYKFAIVPNGELETNDNGKTLAEAIDVYYFDPAQPITARTEITGEPIGTLSQVLDTIAGANNTAEGNLLPEEGKDQDTVTIVLKMRESAGNEYQDMTLGTDFSIQVLATQLNYEKDTFGNDYDADADETPDNVDWPYDKVGTATAADAAQALDVTADKITVTVPAAALAEGDKFELLVDDMEQTTVSNTTTMSFDLKLRRNGALVKEKDGIEYTVKMQLDSELVIDSVKHNGTDITDFVYDSATGVLTFKVSSFSPFEVVYHEDAQVVETGSAESLIDILAEYNESDDERPMVVQLTSDLTFEDGSGFEVESGKEVTIDLNGNNLNMESNDLDCITVKDGGTLTLSNSSDEGVYKFKTTDLGTDPIYVENTESGKQTVLNIENVVIEAELPTVQYATPNPICSIHAFAEDGDAIVNIEEGAVINVKGHDTAIAGIFVDAGSTVNMNGGVINVDVTGNRQYYDAVGVLVGNGFNGIADAATFNMNGGTINVVGNDHTMSQAIQTADRDNEFVTMTGGTINVSGQYACAFGVTYGYIDVQGGTINVDGSECCVFMFNPYDKDDSCTEVKIKNGAAVLTGGAALSDDDSRTVTVY